MDNKQPRYQNSKVLYIEKNPVHIFHLKDGLMKFKETEWFLRGFKGVIKISAIIFLRAISFN